MARRLIIAVAAACVAAALFIPSASAAEDDYFVGLSAYRDGLDDVAEGFLTDYLAGETAPEKARYARYILYRLALDAGRNDEAWTHFSAIENEDDPRFDRTAMALDGMRLSVGRDCDDARRRAAATNSPAVAAIFVESECTVSPEVVDTLIEMDAPPPVMLAAALKTREYPQLVQRLFTALDTDRLETTHLRFFGGYFAKHERWDEFWQVYAVHKDADLVNIALDRLWQIGEREKYLTSYDFNRPEFDLAPTAHCRAVKAHDELGTPYECAILDSCFTEPSAAFVQAKHACLLRGDERTGITRLIASLSAENLSGVCAGAPYMASKNLAKAEAYARLSGCENRSEIAAQLEAAKNADGLAALAGDADTSRARYERGLAYVLRGMIEKAEAEAEGITDADLKQALERRITR